MIRAGECCLRGHFFKGAGTTFVEAAGRGRRSWDGKLWQGKLSGSWDGIQWDTALGLVYDVDTPCDF